MLKLHYATSLLIPTALWSGLLVAQSGFRLPQDGKALIDEYCMECHNFEDWAGSLSFEGLDLATAGQEAETWEHVIRKVSAGLMPPANEPRPAKAVLASFADALGAKIDAQAPFNPGTESLHRLNRNEYANVIRDLLDLEVDVSAMLPGDDASEGFDNIADVLNVSPTLIEAYVSAAMKISRLAVGDINQSATTEIFRAPPGLPQDRHIEGLPLGTRGGIRVEHNFPLDGEYRFSIQGGVGGFRQIVSYPGPEIDFTIDGEQIPVDNPRDFTLNLAAGPKTLTVALVDRNLSAGVGDTWSVYDVQGGIQQLTVVGPLNPSGATATPSRQRIFTCLPESAAQEVVCAETILSNLATRAYRKPVQPGDREMDVLMDFFADGNAQAGFEFGIQTALSRILVDPQFLYRLEKVPANVAPGEVYAISDLELASRLSFFIWSSLPDEELLTLAANGRLREPGVLDAQVGRMLADPKSTALVENFLGQWLHLRELDAVEPETPDWDESLRRAIRAETELVFGEILEQDRSVVDLIDADFTYVNDRLAEHYGIPGIRGGFMRRVTLPEDSPRRGIIGQASMLTVTSVANRTSPVVRGNWILENLLGVPAPVPPPGVEVNLDQQDGAAITTLRQRLEVHRQDPVCASCHNIMDPMGLTLENFDLVGKWRDFDGNQPIDASSRLVDGTILTGPTDLREALLDRSELFVTTFTEKMLSYALGRIAQYYDMPAVRDIVDSAAAHNYRLSEIVKGIALSEPFQKKVKKDNANTSLAAND